MTEKNHWQELLVFFRQDALIAGRHLRRPCPVPLPSVSLLEELRTLARHHGLLPLFHRHLLSSLALPETARPHPGQLPQDATAICPGCTEETLFQARWCCLPILTCRGATASIVWMLLGHMPGWQGFSFIGDPQPQASSLEAAITAQTAIGHDLQSPDYGFLAVTLQHPDEPPLTGGSLALSLALGMLLLDRGKRWPEGVYASGGLSVAGRIHNIAGEVLKYGRVGQDMKMLMYPDTGLLELIPDAKVVRCADLEQAVFALDCVQEGADAGKIILFRACLANPRLFLERFKSLPLGLLSFAAGRKLLARIGNERHRLFPVLGRCLADCHDDPERAAVIADLFSPEEISAIARQDSDEEALVAHRWCVSRIACANRNGAVADSRAWIDLAQTLEFSATKGVEKVDYANHAFVTARFNRYDFRPEPPGDFVECLDIEQRLYGIAQRDNRVLGAMYGTLAQNYGFCGPACRPQFADCIHKAEEAFGRKYRRESLRLLAYQIYSLLDGAQYSEAMKLLNRYLGTPAGGGPQQWIDAMLCLWRRPTEHTPFQTATVCRLLVELTHTGNLWPQPDWCRSLAAMLPGRLSHPWQLTACNLGQLFNAAGLHDQGAALLHRSVDACRAGGITMMPMALMPLAVLNDLYSGDAGIGSVCAEIVQKIRTSGLLHRPHFQPLMDATTPVQILEEVLADRGRYFPFSYR